MESFRDPNKPYPRGIVTRRYESRERTPERDRRPPSPDRREVRKSGRQDRSNSRDSKGGLREWSGNAFKQKKTIKPGTGIALSPSPGNRVLRVSPGESVDSIREEGDTEKENKTFSMKFPKPRILTIN